MKMMYAGRMMFTNNALRLLIKKVNRDLITTVWLRSDILGKTIQVAPYDEGIVAFSEPFGSMEYYIKLDERKLMVMDTNSSNKWVELKNSAADCAGIQNPRMLECLQVLRAVALEGFYFDQVDRGKKKNFLSLGIGADEEWEKLAISR